MISKTKPEEKLFSLIDNEEHAVIINIVREITQKIWSSEVRIVKEYTDHGYEHSQRIIDKIYEILEPFPNVLKENEIFLLLLGVYLHDIGMQCDIKKHPRIKELAIENYSAKFEENYSEGTANSYTPKEQNEIRRNHHLLTGAWIEYSYENETILSPFVTKIESIYLEDLITICKYHSKLSINDCPNESHFSNIRPRLIAAILRFGDELDIDKHRVNIETVNEFSYHTENTVFWYLHSRTSILIKNYAVKMSVYLNDNDYEEYRTYINDIYIQEFKSKNKVLTDIITQSGINIIISEDSAIEKNHFEKNLPSEIARSLKEMYEEQLQQKTKCSLKLLSEESDEETLKQVLESFLGKKEKNSFMQKYKNEFISETKKIMFLIDELKRGCNIPDIEVDEIFDLFTLLNHNHDISIIKNNEAKLTKAYNILLFIKAFTKEQLTFLSDDIRLGIPLSVVWGESQFSAFIFFDIYFEYKEHLEDIFELEKEYGLSLFDRDTFEQIGRVLHAYKIIINFNTKNIEFSNYYVHPNACDGKLLAVSVGGEANKILVWNTESKKHEPVAELGGLVEPVNKIKIYRYKGKTTIAARGIRQIYFWELHLGSGEPTYILKSKNPITDYIVFQSLDNHLYTMVLTEQHAHIWKLFESENPIAFFHAENEIYVINTHLLDSENTYECLGAGLFGINVYPKIIELIETAPLNFKQELRFDIYKIIDGCLKAYTVNKKNQCH